MILGRNVEQDKTRQCVAYKTDNSAFLLLELSPIVLFEIYFVSALQLEYPLEYFDGTW